MEETVRVLLTEREIKFLLGQCQTSLGEDVEGEHDDEMVATRLKPFLESMLPYFRRDRQPQEF